MKMRTGVFFLAVICCVFLSACSAEMGPREVLAESKKEDSVIKDIFRKEEGHEVSIEIHHGKELSFSEVVEMSNCCFVGRLIEVIENDFNREYRFSVERWLYGAEDEKEVYVFFNGGSYGKVEGDPIRGEWDYQPGNSYVLIADREESPVFEHDRYMTVDYQYICPEEGKAFHGVYSLEAIDIPDGKTIEQYVSDLRKAVPEEAPLVKKEYENEFAEMMGESEFVAVVRVVKARTGISTHNGLVYACTIIRPIQGNQPNENGGFVDIVLLKDRVETGGIYLIGFQEREPGAGYYIQTTKNSIFPASEDLIRKAVNSASEFD